MGLAVGWVFRSVESGAHREVGDLGLLQQEPVGGVHRALHGLAAGRHRHCGGQIRGERAQRELSQRLDGPHRVLWPHRVHCQILYMCRSPCQRVS